MEAAKNKFSAMDFITKWGTLITIGLLLIIFSVAMPTTFMTQSNMINIIRSISVVTVIAIGMTISLTVNGMDLSVGSTATLSNTVIMTMFIWYGMESIPAMIIALAISLVVAAVNSFLIVKLRIPDMLTTLSSMFIFEGVAMTYAGGGAISENMVRPDGTTAIFKVPAAFRDFVGKEPWIILIMLAVVLFVYFFLTYTKHGRYMYAVGGNPEAARLSGIPVNKYKTIAYCMAAFFAALGGILIGARTGNSQINAGAPYLMGSVAAAYIGLSVAGAGKANAFGTLAGAMLVGILENGLIMLSVPYYSLNIVKGLVLALALALTYFRKKG